MKILISINPKHVAKILSGEKKFEYRTKAAKKDVDSLIIYEKAPFLSCTPNPRQQEEGYSSLMVGLFHNYRLDNSYLSKLWDCLN